MFPLCSAASCHYHSQILFHGNWRGSSSLKRESIHRCDSGDKAFFGISNGVHMHKVCGIRATGRFFTGTLENTEQPVSTDLLRSFHYTVYDTREGVVPSDLFLVSNEGLASVESAPDVSPADTIAAETLTGNSSSVTVTVEPGTVSTVDTSVAVTDPGSVPDAKASFDEFSSGVKESFSSSLDQGENAVKSTLDSFSSSVTSITKSASEAVDSAFDSAFSTLDQTGDIAGDKFSSFSTGLKEVSNRAASVAIDLLRQSVSVAESSVSNGVSFVVYSYESAKELLPSDVKSVLTSSEDIALKVTRPLGAVLQQVYVAIGGLERYFGLDPDDPIIHLFLFVGTTGSFWALYRVWTYGGYAGDLSAKSTLELLTSTEKPVLVDVRPEALREKDGIPDLRRAARSRYSSVTLPEVDGAVKRLLKGGSEVDDVLTAVIIKNLKAVQDRSKVIVMDADGTRSKGIARALRKLGIKASGYRSWVKEGLRVKEPKPETTLTILNEDAEAILEDINPTPLQVVGVGVGFFAALYALFEWEKTLQLIAVLGLGLTVYNRLSSYDDSEDFKQDVRLLFAPVKLGAQAVSWAAGKLETNGVGLPTSPSSSDVRSRVLQAAAKHESQPSDETSEGLQDASTSSPEEALDNVDLSEA
ncbi:unnamed protein product [Thlaspi arvense]|uniref:Rhodanese domain-containing protein n=1 Tax=Thlaspi arvense TaxID=13288 RepID=A0AAU9SCI9_THLAR|nr:unnamed protein product [Thlaspi arvense]